MNLKDLAFIAKRNTEHFKDILVCFNEIDLWQNKSSDDFESCLDKIKTQLQDTNLQNLFDLYIFSRFLVDKNLPAWAGAVLSDKIDVGSFLPELPDYDLHRLKEKGKWQCVPILVTTGNTGYIRFFIAGLLSGANGNFHPVVPAWAKKLMDDDFLEVIKTAAAHAGSFSGSLVCYPVAFCGNSGQFFKGRSAALPMALNFRSLVKGSSISSHIVCTGDLLENGDVKDIGGLDVKLDRAKKEKYRALICPGGNKQNRPEEKSLIPVSHIEQAWMIASLYEKNNHTKLSLFTACLDDARTFVNHIESFEASWLEWTGDNGSLGGIMKDVCSNPVLLKTCTQKFETLVRTFQLELAGSLAHTVSAELLETMKTTAPSAFLRWCTANIALANHRGQAGTDTEKWEQKGKEAIKAVPEMDMRIDFYNNALVGAHNRYEFSPAFSQEMNQLLIFLEKRYQLHGEFGCSIDLLPGKLYGTLTQNFGFCGAEYIEYTEKFSFLARMAFGEQSNCPEFTPEWQRQYMYLTYARLDANRMVEAEQALNTTLNIKNMDELYSSINELSQWELALVCRFLSETDNTGLNIKQKIYESLEPIFDKKMKNQHPWQLISCNMGRIAHDLGKKDTARELWEKSCELCFTDDAGPTIQVMALLPLSFLYALEPSERSENSIRLEAAEKKIKDAAQYLNKEHFDFLNMSSFKNVLRHVETNLEKVFPFSYR